MISHRIIEGTGEEIAEFAHQHASDRFKLILIEKSVPNRFDQTCWDESLAIIASLAPKSISLPDEAFSTESL